MSSVVKEHKLRPFAYICGCMCMNVCLGVYVCIYICVYVRKSERERIDKK
jgi:hypothetical protein